MLLYDKSTTVGICLKTDEQAVHLAAMDFQRDLRRLSGQEEGFPFSAAGQIEIRILSGEPESYTVEVGDRVVITGADTLGAIYGIYAFEARCMGIIPVHRLVDMYDKIYKGTFLGGNLTTALKTKTGSRALP